MIILVLIIIIYIEIVYMWLKPDENPDNRVWETVLSSLKETSSKMLHYP